MQEHPKNEVVFSLPILSAAKKYTFLSFNLFFLLKKGLSLSHHYDIDLFIAFIELSFGSQSVQFVRNTIKSTSLSKQ